MKYWTRHTPFPWWQYILLAIVQILDAIPPLLTLGHLNFGRWSALMEHYLLQCFERFEKEA